MAQFAFFLYQLVTLFGVAGLSFGTIVAWLLIIFLVVRFRWIRRTIWFVIALPFATVLTVLGLIAAPIWFLTRAIARWLVPAFVVKGTLETFLRFGEAFSDTPLLNWRRLEFAQQTWPEALFPFLYREVPEDIVRPLWEDGRLVGGVPMAWLGDREVSYEGLLSITRFAYTAAFTLIFLPLLFLLWNIGEVVWRTIKSVTAHSIPLEQWPGAPPVEIPQGWWTDQAMETVWHNVRLIAAQVGSFSFFWALFGAGITLIIFVLALRGWMAERARPYELATKDALVRWPYRAESRAVVNDAYRNQLKLLGSRLKNSAVFQIGEATGVMRMRGDLTAPSAGQAVKLDSESIFQHLLVLGGTGEGKTTAIIKPLLRQIMAMPQFGVYLCDAKGVLWRDAKQIAEKAGRSEDVIVIGTGPNHQGVDVIANLTPAQIAATLRSVLRQLGRSGVDDFWPDLASNLIRHVLTIAKAYAHTDHGKRQADETKTHPYSLWWAYQAILNDARLRDAIAETVEFAQQIVEKVDSLPEVEARPIRQVYETELMSEDVRASLEYLEVTWRDMAPETKSGIVASVSQLLDGLAGATTLRERFASGRPTTIQISAALEGKVLLNSLSTVEDGLAARLVSILLKTSLYREARRRETRWKDEASGANPQEHPCLVVMDEVQEVVTADPVSGLSDGTFWNVARSAGLVGLFGTQTIAALKQAIGEEATSNFIQQARSKIFFRSEDKETVEYACWLADKFERNRVYDDGQRESVEHRAILDGWDPFAPLAEDQSFSGGPTWFFRAARYVLFPDGGTLPVPSTQARYEADTRFVPTRRKAFLAGAIGSLWGPRAGLAGGFASFQQYELARLSALQAATWRAEEKEHTYRSQGNDLKAALMPSDIIDMGRWHAFAHVQRAGVSRQDIIRVTHDFD